MTIASTARPYTFPTSSNQTNSNKLLSSDEPKITARNGYVSAQRVLAREIRNEYYSQAVSIDKTFDNPLKHIKDKYLNSNSPYFRSDLTQHERRMAFENERAYLESGGDNAGHRSDPFILEIMGYNSSDTEKALETKFNREHVNGQFEQLLKKHNITIPNDAELTFTIDPYTYKVNVSGIDDKQLTSSIERIMDEENGKQLFFHISQSEWGNNTQITAEKEQKYSIVSSIKNETGYILKNLEIVDGKFVTEDGTDIALLFKQAIKNRTDIEEGIKPFIIGDMYNKLEKLAKTGFDSLPDLVLSIDYKNGSFRDVGQSKGFGTGETGWIVDKGASIQREKISQQITKLLEKDNITILEDTKLTFTLNSDSNKVEVTGTDDTKLSTLLESLLNEDHAKELFLYIFLDQWDKDTEFTYDLLKELLKNGFDLMDDQMISVDYENGSLNEINGQIDWINKIKTSAPSVDIYV
jgi:hypothetical protein